MRLPLVVLALASPLLLVSATAQAAPSDCDHVLGLDAQVVDSTQLGVQPGQSVCVQGGARPFLRLQKFKGAESQVVITTTPADCGAFSGSRQRLRGHGQHDSRRLCPADICHALRQRWPQTALRGPGTPAMRRARSKKSS